MITEEKNQQLTRVGPGTPMSELLRRHWHPIAGVDELDQNPIKAVRLMGENLVLYKDLSGQFGLIDRQCAHRRADLSYGLTEADGIRCNYHGWQYNAQGQCVSQPYEEQVDPSARQRCKIKLKAYAVKPLAGLLWAYMGPLPTPELPDWEPLHWKNGFMQAHKPRDQSRYRGLGRAGPHCGPRPGKPVQQRSGYRDDSPDFFMQGLSLADYQRHPKWARLFKHFIFHAGQPEWVQQAHAEATGVAIQSINVIDL